MTINDLRNNFSTWRPTKARVVHFSIGMAALLIYEFIARPFYRPYIYRNKINDFHIADTIGNSLGTVATIFVLLAIFGKGVKENLVLIKIITISVVLYELAHPLLGKTIDFWDVLATCITGIFCFVAYKLFLPKPEA
jgi:hypothetical protein